MEYVDDASTLSLDMRSGVSGRLVDVKQDMPEPWATAAIRANLVRADGNANLTALARAAGTNVETTRRLVTGRGKSGDEVIRKVAGALNIDVTLASAWANQPREVESPYVPPDEAHRLNPKQREAVTMVIKAMVGDDGERRSLTTPTHEESTADAEATMALLARLSDESDNLAESSRPPRP